MPAALFAQRPLRDWPCRIYPHGTLGQHAAYDHSTATLKNHENCDMNNIKVSIILPVYNGCKYLSYAINSIIMQTYDNFELIILNDGSMDDSENIIQDFKAKDKRIIYIKNEINLGLIATLNRGFNVASGKYIARMDQDDISCPERLRLQIGFLEKLKAPAIVGSNIVVIDKENKVIKIPRNMHTEASENFWVKFRKCPLYHPTVMMSREIMTSFGPIYQPQDIHAEDHCAWLRLNRNFPIYNIKTPLLFYRSHGENYSDNYALGQIDKTLTVLSNNYYESFSYKISRAALESLLFLRVQPASDVKSIFVDILEGGRSFIGRFGYERFVKIDLAYCIFNIGLKSGFSKLTFAVLFIRKNLGYLPLTNAILATFNEGLKQVSHKGVYSLKLNSILKNTAE